MMAALIPDYKTDFLRVCIQENVLTFGTFTLKSKRVSPYFFNAGLFYRADLVGSISAALAQTLKEHITQSDSNFDVLFGPAYKGIPLAVATVSKLYELDPDRFGRVGYSYNRKEAKDHGEGGNIVGAPLKGRRVVIVDDVITAGTAIREAVDIIEKEGATLVGIIIALDRMEKMPVPGEGADDPESQSSAIGEVRKQYNVPVLAILDLNDIIGGLGAIGSTEDVKRLEEYRKRYGTSD